MSEKNMGRKFKVGDKVVFTKEAIDSSMFHKSIQVGDLAVVKSVKSCVGGSFPTEVLPERDGLWTQRVDMDYEPEVYEWFEHADAKKEHKKKQCKHFRMGDFVKLKDEACLEECSIFGDITRSTIGIVCGMGYDGAVEVHFTTVTGYNFDRVYPEALRLATKKERKSLRKHKIAKITYDAPCDNAPEQTVEKETEIPPEYNVKIGDIVEVTQYYGGYSVGTIGQVDTIDENIEGYHNRVIVKSFDGESSSEMNVKLVYRKPETNSK